jgi:ferritin-like metal-binding protein YciE
VADEVLPKLISEVQDDEFTTALEEHLAQTHRHVTNVEKVFAELRESPQAERCIGFEGLKAEHDKLLQERPATSWSTRLT